MLGDLRVTGAFFVVGRNAELPPACCSACTPRDTRGQPRSTRSYGIFTAATSIREAQVDRPTVDRRGHRPSARDVPAADGDQDLARDRRRRRGDTPCHLDAPRLDGVTTVRGADRRAALRGPRRTPGDVLLLHDGVEPNTPRRGDPRDRGRPCAARRAAAGPKGLEPARLDAVLGIPGYQPG